VQSGIALGFDRARIEGSVFLNNGFRAKGEVRLLGAQIGGQLGCNGARIEVANGTALCADGVDVKGDVFLRDGFFAAGQTQMCSALIGGDLECDGGRFEARGGFALVADRTTVGGGVRMCNGFEAVGAVQLNNMRIASDLNCSGGYFESRGGAMLTARQMRVDGRLHACDMKQPLSNVSLAGASVGVLVDDASTWGSQLDLDGFKYGAFGDKAPTDAQTRLRWLDKQTAKHAGLDKVEREFRPLPWRQLQNVLREMGHVEDSRQVAVAFEDRRRHAGLIGVMPQQTNVVLVWASRALSSGLHWLFGVLTGYGYRPIKLLLWFAAIWFFCGVFYWVAALPPHGVFAPTDPLVFQHPAYTVCDPASEEAAKELRRPVESVPPRVRGAGNWYLCEKLREEYSGFSPLAYSLDVILPLVDLNQEKAWGPLIPAPESHPVDEIFAMSWKHFARWVTWFETLFGWIASLLLVAIVSGLAKRRDE
jgi:hypothetical protein